jgi:hypothetical protein
MESNDLAREMKLEDIRFVKELYPRLKPIDDVIERYRAAIDLLPPIVTARGGVLVDGYHRWQAHVREERQTIKAVDLGNLADAEIVRESIKCNASHGQQLSAADKKALATKLWEPFAHLRKEARIDEIAALLSVTPRIVEIWTKDVRAAEKAAAEDRAYDLWLDCLSQREIAEIIGREFPAFADVEHTTIGRWFGAKANLFANAPPPESRQHFDIWQFQAADDDAGAQSYFGALPPQVLENLLWFFTEPGDTVVDLFAGSGTMIDVAKAMGRRVWASDIRGNQYLAHLPIHKHDATAGWPEEAPGKPDLLFLDPPYWKQAKGRYSSEPSELAEMDLDVFNAAWASIIVGAVKRAKRIAYIISPTQNDDGSVIDHATAMLIPFFQTGWRIERRIIVPYQTQRATDWQVNWARDNRRCLSLYRDLVVFAAG